MTELTFDLSNLVPGIYHTYLEPYYLNDTSSSFTVDETGVMPIEIIEGKGSSYRNWLRQYWSSVRLNDVAIISNQKG